MATGFTDWTALHQLFEGLVRVAPTLGAWVGRAAVVARIHGPGEGLACLDQLSGVESFQPYCATRAALAAEAGRDEAAGAYTRALELTSSPLVRRFLDERRLRLGSFD